MRYRGLLAGAVLLGSVLVSQSGFRDPSRDLPVFGVTRAQVEAQVRFLASDELQGRAAGTPGNQAAARYIAEQFRLNGASPVPSATDFMQPFTMEKIWPPKEQDLSVAGKRLEDFLLLSGGGVDLSSEAVDAGYGLETPGGAQPRDLAGKVAVVRYGDGQDGNGYRAMREKEKLLSERGAAAILELYSGDQWEMFRRFGGRAQMQLVSGNTESSKGRPEVAHLLVKDSGGELLKTIEAGSGVEVRVVLSKRQRETVKTENVAGILEGRDPVLKKQWVALTAHFDHLGSGRDLPGATDEDQIFNGARDNGMGTVALLTAAETLGKLHPARSVVLIALNGEELGLLGSRFYVEHPLIPLDDTVFVLNADGGGYEDTSLVTVLGLDRTSEGKQIRRACREFGLEAIPGGEELQHFFNQSDNLPFARKGIPAPTFSPGFRVFGAAIRRFYHQPADQADDNFDFDYLLHYSQAFALASRYIADDREAPRWTPGDEYENVRTAKGQ